MIERQYLDGALTELRKLKSSADKAIAQVDDRQFAAAIDPEANSIALIMKHVAGNMRSRWTDFLTTDGDKPSRDRDREFEREDADTRAAVTQAWETGWTLTLDTVASLRPEDVSATVRIRGEAMTVLAAINRQVTHYAGHVGQIVLLAKHYAGGQWQTLSVPKRKAPASGRS